MKLLINGNSYDIDVDSRKPLLWVLREDLGLNGTKFGCGIGFCGACMVLVDGIATPSCQLEAGSMGGEEITTIEGLNNDLAKAIKEAWIMEKVVQCGYCQPGQIISAYALLLQKPNPSDEDIDKNMTNLCRCGTYQRIRAAIQKHSTLNLNTGVE